ncbi:hypothetical protein EUTSA_v10002820mg [Eutrema salsugineum]|uniref:X8 domain-containing protein n=1 Tax=Eutrema salsugineum TaxID=72664 RepID=V4MX25_EUTSA|nr:hypothetical protein EUTSA_v10002820mg [Eutrema salsugineum]
MMKTFLIKTTISLFLISVTFPQDSEAATGVWCVADPQIPEKVLQAALDWACQQGGADCSLIHPSQPCFLPNTVKDHASVVFNSYYQHYKRKGGSCYFHSAALITLTDPSKQLYLNSKV